MLKYKLIGDNDYIFDPKTAILTNRGINDPDFFLNLTDKVVNDYRLLKNIDKAVACLIKHVDNNSVITIVVDPDADGYTSATVLYQYLKMMDEDIRLKWVLHDDKVHGLDGIVIPPDTNLIIVPDAGSNDFDLHLHYKNKGMDIIILDHHEIDKESEHAIVVNSRLGNYPNMNLSGVGIVYKFCKALDNELWVDYADYFLDLVAVGNIADSMSMGELETRYYVQQGLTEINNDFLNALIRKQEYSMKGKVNITSISFYINPLINAVIRVGTLEDKIDMFKSFIGVKELVKYKPRGSDEMLVPLVEDMARRCTNIKAKQGRMKEKLLPIIEDYINENKLYENQTIIIDGINDIDPGLTGLLATDIVSKYKKPTILLSGCDENGLFKGSARGYDKSELKDFKDIVIKTDLFALAKGHKNAYGVRIHKDNLTQANLEINKLLQDYTFEDVYDVDFELKADALTPSLIREISELEEVWGKDTEEPYLFIRDIAFDEDDIALMGSKENTIGIYLGEIKIMIFKTDKNTFNQMKQAKKINVVGKASINVYKDEEQPQIIVESFEIIT